MSECKTEGCPDPCEKGLKYCKACKKAMLAEMLASGYLEKGGRYRKGSHRTQEMKEDTHQTKHGIDR
jgi:hypothetical protein